MGKDKKQKMNRDQKARQGAKIKQDLKQPINQLLNAVEEDGKTLKYPIAIKLRQYLVANPDPVLNALRMVNGLVHEIRYHKLRAKMYNNPGFNMRDTEGKLMSREECYVSHIKEKQVCHTVLSKLREQITGILLACVDGEIFTLQQFNDTIMNVDKIIKELGYTLFPDKVELIEVL